MTNITKHPMGTKFKIDNIHLEIDRNNEPRLVITDENKVEWAISEQSSAHGFITVIEKKSDSFYFRHESK